MSIAIQELIDQLQPEKTVLIFGAGASISPEPKNCLRSSLMCLSPT